jgi:serine/threonine protein kinase
VTVPQPREHHAAARVTLRETLQSNHPGASETRQLRLVEPQTTRRRARAAWASIRRIITSLQSLSSIDLRIDGWCERKHRRVGEGKRRPPRYTRRLTVALPDGARLGPYEIPAALGAGGMGEVYRARDTRLLREVAIKVLPSDLYSPSADGQRFLVDVFASNAQASLEVILNWAGAEANRPVR